MKLLISQGIVYNAASIISRSKVFVCHLISRKPLLGNLHMSPYVYIHRIGNGFVPFLMIKMAQKGKIVSMYNNILVFFIYI